MISTTAAAATAVTAATAAAPTSGTILRFANASGTAAALGAVEVFDCGFSGVAVGEGYESEPARATGVPIKGHVQVNDGFVGGKEFTEFNLRDLVGQIANIQFHEVWLVR